MKRAWIVVGMLLALGGPRRARADGWRDRVSIAGSITFGISYGFAFGFALRFREARLHTPVLGPLLELDRCRDCAGNSREQPVLAFLVADSLAQATGVALVARRWYKTRSTPQLAISPTLFASGGGLIACGVFYTRVR